MRFSEAILLASLALVGYAWLLYPLLLRVVGPLRVSPVPQPDRLPTLGIILSAHNEERHIAARIRNLFACDYPADNLVVYAGADGCTDQTVPLLRALAVREPRLRVTVPPSHRGKVAMLRDLVAQAREEILVFTDANTYFAPDALRRLVAPFGDPTVGGVCGRLVFHDGAGHATDEGVYWRWESRLKALESRVDSCLGANGAIYAVRRLLFWSEIPANTIVDDFVIGMRVRERGFRLVYEPAAVANEELPPRVADEWVRRVRIGAGDYQALWLCRRCLSPAYGCFAWMFWSHKLLRWFTPHLLLMAVGCAALQLHRVWHDGAATLPEWVSAAPVAVGTLAAVAAGLGIALVGRLVRRSRAAVWAPFRLADYFLVMQIALLAGFVRYCRGGLGGSWQRTAR